jgi:hypothetical protein
MTLRQALARAVHLGLEDLKVGEYDHAPIPKSNLGCIQPNTQGKTLMGGSQYAYG